MAVWWVSQPYINLHVDDTPLSYQPSRGLRMDFRLSYRQRDQKPQNPAIFGVGTNWTASCRAFLLDATGTQSGLFRLHRGGAGEVEYYLDYYVGTPQFFDGSVLTTPDGGQTYQIEHADGARDVFEKVFVTSANETLYFLTARQDPAGNTLTYNYDSNPNIVRVLSITDPDSCNTTFYYENTSFTNLITKVVDPFSRTNLLQYDAAGYLTNIVDVAGLASSVVYDAGARRSWITNLITGYGTTTFRYDGVNADSDDFYDGGNQVNRSVEVTLPNGGKHLYLYRQDCSGILAATSSSVPNTSPSFANTLDNVDQDKRNSFHWDPLQYVALSANYLSSGNVTNLTSGDYILAGMWHWLVEPNTGQASRVPSLKRAPGPAPDTYGHLTWLDYAGKTFNNSNGTSAWPLMEARVLPNGSTAFERAVRNHRGWTTNEVSTYTAPDGASFAPGSPDLRTNVYVYAANGLDLVQHIGPDGTQVVSNYFNAYHQPLASHNALDEAMVYTYNANQQVTSVFSPAGLTTTYVYSTNGTDVGRLEKTIDVEINRTNAYTYYASGLVFSHTDDRGLTTYSYWDNLQRLTGRLFPDGTTTSNLYSALDLTATKDRLGHWSYAAYNEIRLKTSETNANGVITGYGYCECGALLSVTNAWNTPAQMVMSFGYDSQGNRIYTYLPDTTITNWYDSLKRLVMTGDAWGYEWYTYNNQGLLTSISNSFGAKQITIYDEEDRPLYVLDANGVAVTNSYDVLGRLRTRTHPDGGVESFGYSARGMIAYTNQIGATNFYAYDEAGRKTFETNANWEVILYTNSPAGDLLALVDGKNQVTKWKYDEYGRVTNKLDQAGTEILRYKYDPNHRLTNRWSVAKGNTGYAYDAVGNLKTVNYPNSTDVTFAYDALNRVTNMVDAVGLTFYGYNVAGRLYTEDGPWSSDTVTNTFNNRLRTALSLAQPTGVWTNAFGYDAAKRLTSVTSPAGQFDYLLPSTRPSTLVTRLTLPNTSYITNTYDANARLLSTTLKNSSHSTLNSHSYQLNQGNQRTQQDFSPSGSTYNYTYDPIGQLKVADSATASEDRGYQYDTAWNLNYRTNNTTLNTFSVDGKNQLTSAPGGSCTYDNNGNLTLSHGERRSYVYDDENRLVELYVSTHPGVMQKATEFVYDGQGRLRIRREYTYNPEEESITPPPGEEARLQKKAFELLGSSWTLVSETRYVYDGWRVIQERDGSNVPTVSYTRGTDLSGTLEGAGGIGGLLARSHGHSSGNWSTQNYYHADGNGNITYLVNSSQTVAASYRYDPYGNTISSSGSLASANEYRFSSKMVHVGSGLYYYGYRWYEPNFQRWLNRDPIEEEGGFNLYGFLSHDPLSQIDPLGLRNTPWPFNGTVSVDKNCPNTIFWVDDFQVGQTHPGGRTPPWVDVDFVQCDGNWYKIGAGTFKVGCGCSCPEGFRTATFDELLMIANILRDNGYEVEF